MCRNSAVCFLFFHCFLISLTAVITITEQSVAKRIFNFRLESALP